MIARPAETPAIKTHSSHSFSAGLIKSFRILMIADLPAINTTRVSA